MRAATKRIAALLTLLASGFLATEALAATTRTTTDDPPSNPAVVRTEAPETAPGARPQLTRGFHAAPAAGETVYVFSDSLNSRSSPDNEGGWSHYDQSIKPTAWHLDTFLACQGHSWWCGLIDSSWIYDSNRAGYDNDWVQNFQNSVDLSGIPQGTPVTLGFRHRFNAEPDYDYGYIEVYDLTDAWIPLATFTGKVPSSGACDTFTVVIPDSIRAKYNPVVFRFVFTSDVGYSSADGLYNGDGWVLDNITIKAGTDVRFFDDGESGPGSWVISTFPGVGDFFWLRNNVFTEDVCTSNPSMLWTDWDPISLSLIPRMDNLVNTPPIATNRASDVFVDFDVYRNLPLYACFYYHLNFRTKNVGDANWSLWEDPTFFVYYGGNKDWARQQIPLPGAGNKDSVQVQLGVRDYSVTYCEGVSTPGGVYALFDNVALGVIGTAPPSFVVRDIDLFNDTFETGPFMLRNDNFNTPIGDSAVVNVNASFGFKQGFMHYRLNGGSFSSVALTNVAPALPTRFYADVPAASYPANTTLEYYFSATDSINNTSYYPSDATTAQHYLSASILPIKRATNPSLSCFDSLSTVLFVNHFSGRETTPRIADALTALGYRFDTWDVNAPSSGAGNALGGAPAGDQQYHWPSTSLNSLLQYKTIIWHSGDLSSFTITAEDQALLEGWVQQSGKDRNLWISGDDVGAELAGGVDYNSFMSFTCGATFLRDVWESQPQDTLHPIVTGLAGSPAAGRSFHVNGDCPLVNHFDAVAVSPSAPANGKAGILFRYPDNLGAATRYATKYVSFGTDSARTVFMGFSFNLIEEGGERLQTVKAIVQNYFKEQACYVPTGVEEDPAAEAPGIRTRLFQNAPNPFNPETVIRFSVARRGPVEIRIFDVAGRQVRELVDDVRDRGEYSVRWDGTDDGGRTLASGAYFYRFRADGVTDAKKLILLR
ncbi:MAG TPA: FlgD immunoglobulin-like domain containing protein [Candidatus Eisenbacteria bacterium]